MEGGTNFEQERKESDKAGRKKKVKGAGPFSSV